MIERVLVAGGGTGGHLFPGLAVVEELRRRVPELEVLFVGTSRGIEARLLPKLGERFKQVEVQPLLGRTLQQVARNAFGLPRAVLDAAKVVREFRPDLALGLGGYAAGPVLAAAALLRVRSALLEQNAQLGLTNRLLASSVGRAYLTYEQTAGRFGPERARVLGNPVRRAFVEAANMAAHDPAGSDARARSVFVLGGSQGARALNQLVPEALGRAGLSQLGVHVLHQAGAAMVDEVQRRYRAQGIEAEVVPFIDDVARAYMNASLVIARAGASTLAELCAIGRASVLIPLPTSAGGHQLVNARALSEAGAALAFEERGLDPERLGHEVRALLRDDARRRTMAACARRLGKPEAAAAIVDDLLSWFGMPSGERGGSNEGIPSLDAPEVRHGEGNDHGSAPAVQRRPKVKRAAVRLRQVDVLADVAR